MFREAHAQAALVMFSEERVLLVPGSLDHQTPNNALVLNAARQKRAEGWS